MTSYEVELKFPVEQLNELRERVKGLGAQPAGKEEHRDSYYAHPSRDFAATKEALRVRRINGRPLVTYKGPKLPGAVKTRVELEWELAPGDKDGSNMESLFVHLGFRKVADVIKKRESFWLVWRDRKVTITLDDVADVGTFSEIECLADQDTIDRAREDVSSLACELGLTEPEPRSYLRMLLES